MLCSIESCSNNSEDEPTVDCTSSDLDLQVVASTKSDCDIAGSIQVEASGGEPPYVYSIENEDFQESATFEGLFAGNFTLLVSDNLGCTASRDFTLESEPTGITLTLTSSNSECTSSSGSVSAQANGGVGTLLFSINGSTFSEAREFNTLSAGEYTVSVKDEENCEVKKTTRVKTNTSLANDIMPIIQKDCAISGCHNGSQSPRLVTKEEVVQNAVSIKSETQAGTMPRDRSFTEAEINLIACWVDDGANNN